MGSEEALARVLFLALHGATPRRVMMGKVRGLERLSRLCHYVRCPVVHLDSWRRVLKLRYMCTNHEVKLAVSPLFAPLHNFVRILTPLQRYLCIRPGSLVGTGRPCCGPDIEGACARVCQRVLLRRRGPPQVDKGGVLGDL